MCVILTDKIILKKSGAASLRLCVLRVPIPHNILYRGPDSLKDVHLHLISNDQVKSC